MTSRVCSEPLRPDDGIVRGKHRRASTSITSQRYSGANLVEMSETRSFSAWCSLIEHGVGVERVEFTVLAQERESQTAVLQGPGYLTTSWKTRTCPWPDNAAGSCWPRVPWSASCVTWRPTTQPCRWPGRSMAHWPLTRHKRTTTETMSQSAASWITCGTRRKWNVVLDKNVKEGRHTLE